MGKYNTENNIKVQLLNMSSNPEEMMATAARLCYSKYSIDEILEKMKNGNETECKNMIDKIMTSGHYSVLEHCTFTFSVENISRVTEIQLLRTRTASPSVQSGRYVDRSNVKYMIPPKVAASHKATEVYLNLVSNANKAYEEITNILKEENPDMNIKSILEDARYVQPQSLTTKLIFTIDLRNFINLVQHRRCKRAQWEIRKVVNMMFDLVRPNLPNVSKYIGANCETSYCKEGSMSCKNPIKKTI